MKKRVFLLVVLFVVLAVAMTGCRKAKLRSQLKEMMGSTIVLPECTTCRISHIGQYHELYQLSQEKGSFEVVILLSNVDKEFLKLNPVVPEDHGLHAFLVDDKGFPLCVGDPVNSEIMHHVFIAAVDYLTSNSITN